MKSRMIRAVLAAVVASLLVIAGAAEYAPPGPKVVSISLDR